MKIIVLGGAGKMGSISVQELARHPDVSEVVIADLNPDATRTVADYLHSPKVSVKQVDLQDRQALVSALAEVDACVNATVYYTNLQVMDACLETRTHYTDMGGLFHTTLKQLEYHDRFVEAGISAVLGMGTAPGLPNIQTRYAADRMDTITHIRIYDGIKPPPPGQKAFTYAVPTIVDEMTLEPMVFRGGQFIACQPLTEFEDYSFTEPLGILPMHLSLHSEVATLPASFKDKGVQECFFKINYWGMAKELVEKVAVLAEFGLASREPVIINGTPVAPRDMLVALMEKYVPPITAFLAPPVNHPPDWVKEIVTEIRGTEGGKPVTYRMGTLTVKGSLPTGVVPARGAIWQAKGRVPPGVHPPETAFDDPMTFLKELEDVDIYTQATVTRGL
jgi:saccharopine dehydrogenase-like NADP-dependent oxidoreductase